ncbi:MAG: urease accessory UreF family protein, partial [Pseudomonadota bacterium]
MTALLRLINWTSPSLPTGAFSYSHGLEAAFAEGLIASQQDVAEWLEALVTQGSGWNDAVFCSLACRTPDDAPALADLCSALASSKERYEETVHQGAAFLRAAKAWGKVALATETPFPVAFGAVAGREGISAKECVAAYLNGFVSNLIQVAIRLGAFGQQGGVEVLASLEPVLEETAERAATATEDDLGSAALMS